MHYLLPADVLMFPSPFLFNSSCLLVLSDSQSSYILPLARYFLLFLQSLSPAFVNVYSVAHLLLGSFDFPRLFPFTTVFFLSLPLISFVIFPFRTYLTLLPLLLFSPCHYNSLPHSWFPFLITPVRFCYLGFSCLSCSFSYCSLPSVFLDPTITAFSFFLIFILSRLSFLSSFHFCRMPFSKLFLCSQLLTLVLHIVFNLFSL